MDSLRYWVQHMHVDGFRFDLASVLSRGEDNRAARRSSDPVGHRHRPGARGHARSSPRRGTRPGSTRSDRSPATAGPCGTGRSATRSAASRRATHGTVRDLADAISGSPNLFGDPHRDPMRSVNFVDAHDGFTLNDLVSYDDKHNEANGEDNRDGSAQNDSWNCGAEGPYRRPRGRSAARAAAAEPLRGPAARPGPADVRHGRRGPPHPAGQQQRLLPGQRDQLVRLGPRRTQLASLFDFVARLLRFRRSSPFFRDERFWAHPGGADITWHGSSRIAPTGATTPTPSRSNSSTRTTPTRGCTSRSTPTGKLWSSSSLSLPATHRWALAADTAAAAAR